MNINNEWWSWGGKLNDTLLEKVSNFCFSLLRILENTLRKY